MKKLLFFLIILFAVLFLSKDLFSQPVPMLTRVLNENQISENLLIGLQSCNKGLTASCAYLIGEFCCKKSVIPLMALLHNAECEEIRILAALSLCKIGDARGVFAVKTSALYDDSQRVKRLCGLFYKAVLAGKVEAKLY
ncbi:MAG: hypothetical protein IPJ23_14375 [Ignavibacteriales bacterium]|nr:hypothetical protein [Ignavibacteriales bacterium]